MHGFIFIFVSYALWQTFKNRYTTICSLLLISGILFFILKEDIRRLKSEEFVVDVHVYKEVIEKNYPNKSFVLYSCGDRSRAETQALVFLMYHDHRLSESGMKIGIPSDDCTDPTIYKKKTLDKRWYYVSLKHAKPEILKQYWIKTTPESVYEANEEWWK
jgi:hypothetical protein